MSIDQDDWSGGRGSDDYEKDRTRFFDNYRTQVTSSWHHPGREWKRMALA